MSIADATFESAKRAFVADDFPAAERLCRSMIAMAPRDARPWIILTDVALNGGQPLEALKNAEKALSLDRHDPFACLAKVKCLTALGRLKEAVQIAEAGVRIKGCPAVALDELGRSFSQLGRHKRSFEVLRMAVALEPRNFLFLYNLAIAERTFGALEDAERHCDEVIAFNPHFHRAHFIRADLRKQTTARNHIAQMEGLLARGVPDPYGEVLLRFALGKECEDIGDDEKSFRHIAAGAALHRRHLRYDVRDDSATIDRIIATQTRDTLSAMPEGFLDDAPIFIVGLPRSGTTLVERIVAAHSEVTGGGELGAFTLAMLRNGQAENTTSTNSGTDLLGSMDNRAVGQDYSRIARDTGLSAANRFTDKYPPNFLFCGAIHAALPNAKIIAVKRQPMDTCFALFKAHFANGAYPYSYDLGELAEYYLGFRRLMEHWKSTLPEAVFLEVSYEDIVHDLEGQSRKMLSFLGLPWQDEVLNFHALETPTTTASAVQVRQPLYASSIGKWERFATGLQPLRDRLEAGPSGNSSKPS